MNVQEYSRSAFAPPHGPALDRVRAALAAHGFTPDRSGRYRCPAHRGTLHNLSVKAGRTGALLKCWSHDCAAGDIGAAIGLELRDLFDDAHGTSASAFVAPVKAALPPAPDAPLLEGVPNVWGESCDLLAGAFWPSPRADFRHSASYRYRLPTDPERLSAIVDRFDPLVPGARKQFLPRRPDGRGGWTLGLSGGVLPLYRLPEALERGEGVPLYVAEGEKTVEALRAAGRVAVSCPGGAKGWRAVHTRQLVQCVTLTDDAPRERVVLAPDDDTRGDEWLAALRHVCRSHRIPFTEARA